MRLLVAVLLLLSARASADGEGGASRLQEATMERRVFRQIFVGTITYPSRRLTWVLHRGGDQARLEVFCQEGNRSPTKGIRLDGRELDEAYWLAPQVTRYAGTRTKALTYELRRNDGPKGDKSACSNAPDVVTLLCANGNVRVRPAAAVLIPGRADDPENIPPPTWKPTTQQKVAALRCHSNDESQPLFGILTDHPAVFVPPTEASPGIEWADENSDMVVQEGAYRRLAVGR